MFTQKLIIMSGSILRMCCEFRIIIVKQLQTLCKKQWSNLGFAQLSCSFQACHYNRTCEINFKLSHRKSRPSICSDTYNLAVQFISGLKSASKLELSFSSTLLFISSSQLVQFSRSVIGRLRQSLTPHNVQLPAHTLSICIHYCTFSFRLVQ